MMGLDVHAVMTSPSKTLAYSVSVLTIGRRDRKHVLTHLPSLEYSRSQWLWVREESCPTPFPIPFVKHLSQVQDDPQFLCQAYLVRFFPSI